jgi:hypothetical protein
MADSLQEFGDLFSETKYKIYNPETKIVGLTKPVSLNLDRKNSTTKQKINANNNYDVTSYMKITPSRQADELSIIPHNTILGSRETSDNYIFFSSGSDTEIGLKYIDDFIANDSSLHEVRKYSPRKILNNTMVFSEYEEPTLDDGDQAWLLDSEVNQNWLVNTKFDSGVSQYNFISSSLEQKAVEQAYYSRFMPRNSSVLSSKEANNLLWKLKKKNKRINVESLMRLAQETDDDETVQPTDYFKSD